MNSETSEENDAAELDVTGIVFCFMVATPGAYSTPVLIIRLVSKRNAVRGRLSLNLHQSIRYYCCMYRAIINDLGDMKLVCFRNSCFLVISCLYL
jgi:hypothetical protein